MWRTSCYDYCCHFDRMNCYHLSGVLGLACTVVALAIFGADKMVIAAMVLILICLLAGRRKLCS